MSDDSALSPKQSLDNAFTIKDLSSLLKNLEAEITLNEQHLNDENDKRYMFKVRKYFPFLFIFSNCEMMEIFNEKNTFLKFSGGRLSSNTQLR